jgi:hypothetical protein
MKNPAEYPKIKHDLTIHIRMKLGKTDSQLPNAKYE